MLLVFDIVNLFSAIPLGLNELLNLGSKVLKNDWL